MQRYEIKLKTEEMRGFYLTTDWTDLTDEKGKWVGEMDAHTEKIFGRTDGTDGTDFGSR